MKKRLSIAKLFEEAKQLLENNNINEADEKLDLCLVVLSKNSLDGKRGTHLLEGTKMDVWYERVWTTIEKAGLLPE